LLDTITLPMFFTLIRLLMMLSPLFLHTSALPSYALAAVTRCALIDASFSPFY